MQLALCIHLFFLLLNGLAIKAGSCFRSDGASTDTVFLRELIKKGRNKLQSPNSFHLREEKQMCRSILFKILHNYHAILGFITRGCIQSHMLFTILIPWVPHHIRRLNIKLMAHTDTSRSSPEPESQSTLQTNTAMNPWLCFIIICVAPSGKDVWRGFILDCDPFQVCTQPGSQSGLWSIFLVNPKR